jgi:hypothetical protein
MLTRYCRSTWWFHLFWIQSLLLIHLYIFAGKSDILFLVCSFNSGRWLGWGETWWPFVAASACTFSSTKIGTNNRLGLWLWLAVYTVHSLALGIQSILSPPWNDHKFCLWSICPVLPVFGKDAIWRWSISAVLSWSLFWEVQAGRRFCFSELIL